MKAKLQPAYSSSSATVANTLVTARRQARALPGFPGALPATLAEAYACQDAAIELWPDRVVGWKVGYITPDRRDAEGDDRVTGPIFNTALWPDQPGISLPFPVFVGGFAAVEAEYVFCLSEDAPPERLRWTVEQAARLATTLHIGVETAGSPMAMINELGPAAVVADFGNNAGLIIGREIPCWTQQSKAELRCECFIDGYSVGHGGASSIPGGLLGALAFALGRCARRGMPLRAGMLVTTGAATGIHDIRVGQHAQIDFGSWGAIECHAVAATPQSGGTES